MSEAVVDRLSTLYRREFERLRPVHESMGAELDFCFKLDHYRRPKSGELQDDDEPTPRGRELVQLVEHEAAAIAKSDIFFEVLPIDRTEDPYSAELMKAALRWELFHPDKGYQRIRDRMVLGALAARQWGARVDYHGKIGAFGELVFSNVDGRDVAWNAGFATPHHPACPDFQERCLMTPDEIKAMPGWENTQDLEPDALDEFEDGLTTTKEQEIRRRGQSYGPEQEGFIRVVKLWERGVMETRKGDEAIRRLPEAEQHMGCLTCGEKGPMQATFDQRLPLVGVCPGCGGMAERIDAVGESPEMLKFARGQRFTIHAPYKKRIFVPPSAWPNGLLRLPYCIYQPKPNPAEQIGESETTQHNTMQVSSNEILALSIEHLRRAKTYHVLPRSGTEDFAGKPFDFSRSKGLGIWTTQDYRSNSAQTLQGDGLPAGMPAVFNMVQSVFKGNMGVPDLGLGPSQSRDIAVGTIRALIETGDLKLGLMIERLRWEEGPFFGAITDLIRSTYTPARARRFQGKDGRWQVMDVFGPSLANYDIQVITSPSLLKLNQAELQTLIEFASAPPHMRKFLARKLNVAPSEVIELEEEELRMRQEHPELYAQEQPGQNGNGGMPPEIARRMAGATHGGISP